MSWADRIATRVELGQPLSTAIDALLEQQLASWPLLQQGKAALAEMRTRRLQDGASHVVAQSNPGRMVSSSAKVDPASVAERPCFLCEQNLPPPERGIAFGDELILFPNPFPILPRHLTIPAREHAAQAITGRSMDLVSLTRSLGRDMLALYNGPRCGASAPDHFHLQAASARDLPVAIDARAAAGGAEIEALELFGRRLLLIRSEDAARTRALIDACLDALSAIDGDGEPMLNLVATHAGGLDTVYFFPRAKHRPACYFADGEERLLISPGALDLAGWVVVAEPEHFDRVDAARVHAIFDEVSLEPERFARLVEAVT